MVPDEPTHVFIKILGEGRELWLGATDEKSPTIWKWLDGTDMKFKAWNRDEPTGGKEHYLEVTRNGGWNDCRDDDLSSSGYICEWKAK